MLRPTREHVPRPVRYNYYEWLIIVVSVVFTIWFIRQYCMGGTYSGF